jgi:two-component system response regulator HydG
MAEERGALLNVAIGDTKSGVRALSAVTRERLSPVGSFGPVLGHSPAMRRIYALAERLARSAVPVILEGETGTGKELLAEAIHDASDRSSKPFVVFDCTLGPASLVDDTLFGHERGAFTGATSLRRGVFELADGGTLLLDEIGDLDLALQAKLLRAVQEKRVQRLGSTAFLDVDVRVIAATRRDLDRAIQEGRFRDDLYYRLAVARMRLPPLRERAGDVRLLAASFWEALSADAFPEDLVQHLERHDWPGNIRELRNAVAHRLALGDLSEPQSLSLRAQTTGTPPSPPSLIETDRITEIAGAGLPFAEARRRVLEIFEASYLDDILARHGGNVTRAAAAAGIARRYFYDLKTRREGAT